MVNGQTQIKWYETVRGRLLFCFLSGAVFSMPYYAEWAFVLTYVALASFFWLLWEGTLDGHHFGACFCFCLGLQWTSCAWLASMYPLPYFGFSRPVSFLLVAACCVLLPAFYALVMACVLQLGRLMPHQPIFCAIGYGALWAVAEWVLTIGDMAFPWATVALSQTGCLPLLQTVSLFGTGWLAWFAVSVCALIAQAFLHGKRYLLAVASGMFACVFAAGCVLLALPADKKQTISVAAIQGNITADQKWNENALPAVFETYKTMTEQAAKAGAKLILLPESAVTVQFAQDGVLHTAFAEIATKYDCTVVMGVLRYEGDALYNSMVAISPDGSLTGFYNKRHAVPFGEKTPFDAVLPDLCPDTDLTVGGTDVHIEANDLRMGCMICFDSVFAGDAQASSELDLLLLATNDAWFGDGAGPAQHLRHAKLRAVECGKALLRAGNTGISAVIDRDGSILTQSELGEQTILYGDLPVYGGTTLFAYTQEWFVLFAALIALICIAVRVAHCTKKITKNCQIDDLQAHLCCVILK